MTALPTAAQSRYIDTAEVAALIRPLLKREFPGVKFSVRSKRYSGGSSIDVGWTNGPTPGQVEKIVNAFAGHRFEGMTDCQYSADSWFCAEHGARVAQTRGCDLASNNGIHDSRCCAAAELVHFGSGYIFTRRELTAEFRAMLRAHVIAEAGLPLNSDDDTPLPDWSRYAHGRYDTVRDGIYRASLTH